MISATLGTIFDFLYETNVTEEYFYAHKGKYPVFSGQTEEQGIIAQIDSYNQTKPCVTFTTYGRHAGKMYYRHGKYTIGRNCMGLRPKPKYKNKINLKWFAYHFQNQFYRRRIGNFEGQRSLNKTLLENLKLVIANKNFQEIQLASYERAQRLLDRKVRALQKCQWLMNTRIGKFQPAFTDTIGNIFDVIGGQSGLTEEFIYNNSSSDQGESIPILSAATIEANKMGVISRNATVNDGPVGPVVSIENGRLVGMCRGYRYFTVKESQIPIHFSFCLGVDAIRRKLTEWGVAVS